MIGAIFIVFCHKLIFQLAILNFKIFWYVLQNIFSIIIEIKFNDLNKLVSNKLNSLILNDRKI